MSELVNFLKETASTGEIITLAYAGGSRPFEARELVVASFNDDTIRVIESGARAQKQYKLDRILWVQNAQGERVDNLFAEQHHKAALPRLGTLSEYVTLLEADYEGAGWNVHRDQDRFGVGTYFKNGKAKKTPSVAIAYFDRSTQLVWDLAANDLVEKKRELTGNERPWRVDSWRFREGKSFGLLYSAMEVFVEEVNASNPINAKSMFAGH